MINFGIIGTGSIAATFSKACTLSGCARVAGVYSRSMETGMAFAAKNAPEAAVSDSIDSLCAQVDAVYIASPNSLHYPQALQCLRAGCHVLCEKPATVTPEQLEHLLDEAERRGLVFMEAMMSLHQPQLDKLRRAIDRCGRVSSSHIRYCQLSSKYPALLAGEMPNVFNPKLCTGALMDIGVYCVSAAVMLFGTPNEAVARAVFLPTGADGAGSALLHYDDKCVSLEWSKISHDAFHSQILGDKGTVTVDLISMLSGIYFVSREGRENLFPAIEQAEAMANEVRRFVRFVGGMHESRDEYQDVCSHMINSAKLMETLRRSAGIKFSQGTELPD